MDNMEVILHMNDLALKLHHDLAANRGNVFMSPASMSAALAMLQRGATGKTAKEFLDITGNDGNEIGKLLCSPPKDCTVANALFAQKGLSIKQEYIEELANNFGAQIMLSDFQSESEHAVSEINDWVREKTNNAIQYLVESIDKETSLILLNAVHFKGAWVHKFDKQKTIQQKFYCNGYEGNAKFVNMMHIKNNFAYAEEEHFQALKLEYDGDGVVMIILLPSLVNELQALENQLKSTFIQDLDKIWRKREVQVSLPKFRVEFSTKLKKHLQNIGFQHIFDWTYELSGISDSEKLQVSEIHHKAVLVVDEEGCEAAAATAMLIKKRSRPIIKQFVVDRPFFFVICNAANNLIMFMGRIEEL